MAAVLVVATLAVLVASPGQAAPPGETASPEEATRSFFVTVEERAGETSTIGLDATLYTPDVIPAPAVLLAHGFGQTKAELAPQARRLQDAGYVVLAYTARGFGASGGQIELDSLDAEVPDARTMVDVLARDKAVERRDGDPVVGVVGGSYGGALALMLGATDPRVDTVVAAITWNNLADALAPSSAGRVEGTTGTPLRDVKIGWAARLFGVGLTGTPNPCGRFAPGFCTLYRTLTGGGALTSEDLALLARSSPSTVLDGMRAPTLLLQGVQDRLFGLDQADANARQIRAAGAPVQVRWFDGGHDSGGFSGGESTASRSSGTDAVIEEWLADHLQTTHPVGDSFVFAVPASASSFEEDRTAPHYPGLEGTAVRQVPLPVPAQTVVNPPGGQPASITNLPGLDQGTAIGRTAHDVLSATNPPAEAATFVSSALLEPEVLAGAARVQLRVTPGRPGPVVLYAELSVRAGDAVRALPGGVAPIRVDLPVTGGVVDVVLPATTWSFAPGDRVVLTVRTSDTQFNGARDPATTRIQVDGPLTLPTVAEVAVARSAGLPPVGVLIAIGAVLLLAVALLVVGAAVGRRPAQAATTPLVEGPPLQIDGLVKRFPGGFLAVDDVGFTAERGQVLGLLGENGAGKTTTLRMVAGLLHPDSGTVRSFGVPLGPGSPALDRIGCFIEGPGFLDHLTGRHNLDLYWAATGRPRHEARFGEVLAVADLGDAISKRVAGYSQGMRQRLAIAQAMLGMPDLLILDEPTNGLDPPQITALRGVLQRYAAQGKTVVVSSHLLGEVERTCSHLVVMSHGRVVAAGTVAEIAGDTPDLVLGVTDAPAAIAAARLAGVEAAEQRGDGTVGIRPGPLSPQALVAALVGGGIGVTSLTSGRRLEEAFLELIGAKEPSP